MPTPAHIFKTARSQMRKIRRRGPKSEEERRLVASADQQREQGLGWRYDGFSEWSDAELLAALKKVGIELDAAQFAKEAAAAGTPTALGEQWHARSTATGRWADLPVLAARELWRRLAKDRRTPEVVADEVDELLQEAEIRQARPALWLEAARKLVAACLRDGKADPEFFAAVVKETGSDLVGWMVEMPPALLDTPDAAEAPALYEAFARLADEKVMRAERCEILARVGRGAEAKAEIDALLAQHGEDALVLLKGGAVHEILKDVPRSQELFKRYEQALRLSGTKKVAQATREGVAMPQGARTGPNDHCPCGSGKKFKRCHGLAS